MRILSSCPFDLALLAFFGFFPALAAVVFFLAAPADLAGGDDKPPEDSAEASRALLTPALAALELGLDLELE